MGKFLILTPAISLGFILAWAAITERPTSAQPKPPPPTAASQVPDPKSELKRQKEDVLRVDACRQIEGALRKDGYNVRVMPMKDDTVKIVIVGMPVDGSFMRMFIRSGIKKGSRRAEFGRLFS
ncbi:MAG: hypothetical protein HY508_13385 [Acidobacteria bacterium]|nr:hypothetical protein [Acidobacteriota bacterium]